MPRKNIKPFSGFENGLIEIKLAQLINAKSIDRIYLSTNDDEILEYARSLKAEKIHLHRRSEDLSSSETSTDQLVGHALDLIPNGNILWTHVTSPFITSTCYDSIVERYNEVRSQGFDSLMTTTPLHAFLWRDGKPMNYDRNVEKWPRTQTLTPVHEINSGAFLAPTSIYRDLKDRIGKRPYLYAMDKLISHDIDWPEDFAIAESLYEKGLVTV